jgi:hypothetical protein
MVSYVMFMLGYGDLEESQRGGEMSGVDRCLFDDLLAHSPAEFRQLVDARLAQVCARLDVA